MTQQSIISSEPIELFTCTHRDNDMQVRLLAWRHDEHHMCLWYPQGENDDGARLRLHDGLTNSAKLQEIHYSYQNYSMRPAPLLPGEFHPRVWRNGISGGRAVRMTEPYYYGPDLEELRSRLIAFHRIQRMLADVFEVVTPISLHDDVTGGAMRQILLLAAVEIEGLLKGAYQLNAPTAQKNPNIHALAALSTPMRLAAWELSYSYYEGSARSPFAGWTPGQTPTWWTAYNRLKHEPSGTTRYRDVLDCCLAVRALIEAQFGPHCESILPPAGLATIEVKARPEWTAEELYFPATPHHHHGAHRPKPLF